MRFSPTFRFLFPPEASFSSLASGRRIEIGVAPGMHTRQKLAPERLQSSLAMVTVKPRMTSSWQQLGKSLTDSASVVIFHQISFLSFSILADKSP